MKLTVRSTGMLQDLGGNGYAQEIHVVDEERPWLEVRLGVREWTDADIVFFRLATVHITSEDATESKPTSALRDGGWWSAVLDAALEHIAFNTSAFDRAAERSPGAFTYLYGWEDGDVQEAEIRPAEPEPRDDPGA